MRYPVLAAASALCALAPLAATAANDPWSAPFGITIGAFDSRATTQIRLDGEGGRIGTTLNFEGDLGLDKGKALPSIDMFYRFTPNHAIEGSWVSLHRDGTRLLQGQVNWGDITFPVNTSVTSTFDSDTVRLAYRWSPINTEEGELGLLLGLHYTRLKTSLDGSNLSLSQEASIDFPLPTIGVRGSWRIWENVRLSGFGQFLKIKIGDYDGSLYNFAGGVEWAFSKDMLAGLGYDYYKYEVTSTKSRAKGQFDYTFDGPKVYFGWNFR